MESEATVTIERVTITEYDATRYRVTVDRRAQCKASVMFVVSAVELAYLEEAAGKILRPTEPESYPGASKGLDPDGHPW